MSVTPAPERERLVLDRDAARRFADLGVSRLILFCPGARDEKTLLGVIADVEKNLIGKV